MVVNLGGVLDGITWNAALLCNSEIVEDQKDKKTPFLTMI